MKLLFLTLLLNIAFVATAQTSTSTYSSTRSQINDNDKTLSIQIEGQRNGQQFAYNRTFNVRGMNRGEKDALKNRVLDSLGLGETPPTPHRPLHVKQPVQAESDSREVPVTFTCPTCEGRVKLIVSGPTNITEEFDAPKKKGRFPRTMSLQPGAYYYEYWQNGVQQMHLPFIVKTGQQNEVTVK